MSVPIVSNTRERSNCCARPNVKSSFGRSPSKAAKLLDDRKLLLGVFPTRPVRFADAQTVQWNEHVLIDSALHTGHAWFPHPTTASRTANSTSARTESRLARAPSRNTHCTQTVPPIVHLPHPAHASPPRVSTDSPSSTALTPSRNLTPSSSLNSFAADDFSLALAAPRSRHRAPRHLSPPRVAPSSRQPRVRIDRSRGRAPPRPRARSHLSRDDGRPTDR